MIAGYDSQTDRVVILASPTELEQLAKQMRTQAANALGGDSTTVVTLPVKDWWAQNEPMSTTVEIGYLQGE